MIVGWVAACQPPQPSSGAGPSKGESKEPTAETPVQVAEPPSAPVAKPENVEAPQLPELPNGPLAAARDGFELVSAGSEPLTVLRFGPSVGQVELAELTMRMSMSISGAGIPVSPQKIPPIRQRNRAEVLSVGDGRIVEKIAFEQFELVDEGVDPRLAKLMQEKLAALRGFEQQFTYDERGGVIEGEITIPPGTSEQLAKTLETMGKTFRQVMVQLPEQAVGVGAIWRETRTFPSNGIEIEQTTQFELLAHDGNHVTLATQVSQKPLGDTMTVSDSSRGPVKMIEFDSRGSGQVSYDLSRMMPEQVDTQMRTHFVIEADIMGQGQEMISDIAIDLQLRRVNE